MLNTNEKIFNLIKNKMFELKLDYDNNIINKNNLIYEQIIFDDIINNIVNEIINNVLTSD